MAFLRFVLLHRDGDSGVAQGVFERAYELRRSRNTPPQARRTLQAILTWFENNLDTPGRFNRTRSKGYYRRRTKGISWLRDSATEHLSRMRTLQRILEDHGDSVEVVREERVGYLVYEDAFQVVAEPFADTRTGATVR